MQRLARRASRTRWARSDVYTDALVFGERSLSIRIDDLIASVSRELRFPGYGLSDDQKKYWSRGCPRHASSSATRTIPTSSSRCTARGIRTRAARSLRQA